MKKVSSKVGPSKNNQKTSNYSDEEHDDRRERARGNDRYDDRRNDKYDDQRNDKYDDQRNDKYVERKDQKYVDKRNDKYDDRRDQKNGQSKQSTTSKQETTKNSSGEVQPKKLGITSILGDYKNHYDEVCGSDEESEENRYDSDEDGNGEKDTPKTLEKELIKTIKEFATFVSSITKDLEEKEQDMMNALKEKKKALPKPIWEDSTFKIDFTKSLILKVFQPERLMKYYIIFLLPTKRWIDGRKEKFFLKAKIFPGAPEADIKFFRDLWSIEGTLSEDEKNTIWDYWDVQIEIVERWKELTGWEINPDEKLNIPTIDYAKAAKDAGLDDSDD